MEDVKAQEVNNIGKDQDSQCENDKAVESEDQKSLGLNSDQNSHPVTEEKEKSEVIKEDSQAIGENNAESKTKGHGVVVAAHYNSIEEKGLKTRNESRIVYLRNFNNWIKSMLISEYLSTVRDTRRYGSPIRVLDMCCGKGGDLLKWRTGDIKHLICVDIAETSVEQCKNRYDDMFRRESSMRRHHNLFTAEFHVADCTKIRLREKYRDPSIDLDLVSCQFSFHYSFESLSQAECMLRNVSECLRPGGYFIGTIPDANDIVKRFRENGSKSFGNSIYKIEFENPEEPFPLFGAKYNFSLKDVVNCPEFLVHLPTLEKLGKKFGLELMAKEKFDSYFEKKQTLGRGLLGRMQALETYPSFEGSTLYGEAEEYVHAKEYSKANNCLRMGTLSRSEWEAASLYMVFAFRKMKPVTKDSEGRPVYEPSTEVSSQPPAEDSNNHPSEVSNEPSSEVSKEPSSEVSKEPSSEVSSEPIKMPGEESYEPAHKKLKVDNDS